MRKAFAAICLFLSFAIVTVQTAQAASPNAGAIFNALGGTTTIDRGGAIHSQARSIYSLGGGMVSFQGKKVSLLAVDPPSFSAGCNGISWHFGGFAFISLDEIRQLVEAVAQASLGIAVDLAMQTLCPQCYAVMSKLRDMANMMRNAAADACSIAKNFGDMLSGPNGIFNPQGRATKCSTGAAEDGKTSSFLDSWAGAACRGLQKIETALDENGDKTMDFLKFGNSGSGKTPDRETLEAYGNVTYRALTALGYEDGVVKDLLLSMLGMTVNHPKSGQDCRTTFKNFMGSASEDSNDAALSAASKDALAKVVDTPSSSRVKSSSTNSNPTPSNVSTDPAQAGAGGATKGPNTCYAPPLLAGVQSLGQYLMCGPNVEAEMIKFAKDYYGGDLADLKTTSLGAMCASVENMDERNPFVYTCRKDTSGECTEPKITRLNTILASDSVRGYTGMAWIVGSALFDGMAAIRKNEPLSKYPHTVKVLSNSGWPLYRLLNMAAVYPMLTNDLLEAYASAIAAQYAIDSIDKVARIGAQPAIDMAASKGIRPESVTTVREQIMNMIRVGDDAKTAVLERLAEKRKLVDVVVQVNKALQAEVIGQNLSGNASLAVTLKRQAKPSTTTTTTP